MIHITEPNKTFQFNIAPFINGRLISPRYMPILQDATNVRSKIRWFGSFFVSFNICNQRSLECSFRTFQAIPLQTWVWQLKVNWSHVCLQNIDYNTSFRLIMDPFCQTNEKRGIFIGGWKCFVVSLPCRGWRASSICLDFTPLPFEDNRLHLLCWLYSLISVNSDCFGSSHTIHPARSLHTSINVGEHTQCLRNNPFWHKYRSSYYMQTVRCWKDPYDDT